MYFNASCVYDDRLKTHKVKTHTPIAYNNQRVVWWSIGWSVRTRRVRTYASWWAIRDSNPGPTGYEPVALTN